ncbi:MAG TPA: hypothetical protein DCE56_05275 [Cyanobacteria bacterium UBA8553]|nr:hypothetical protein [Cyanobacteria bacterium UBA8553]HAJ60336.1 hypothetical protein [Cyanobacteria bacterium UBA8543]
MSSRLTPRLILAVLISPLSVAYTLRTKDKKPFSRDFWINFALMLVPVPGTAIIHAFWFILNEERKGQE